MMKFSPLFIINLIITTLLPVGVTVLLHLPKIKAVMNRLSKGWRNSLYGVIYGLTAGVIVIFGTTPILGNTGVTAYVVDAPSIIAGLIFDFPVGIIAGIIGGIIRYSAILWSGDSALLVLCSFAILFDGILATLVKILFFKGKNQPTFIHGMLFGFAIEIINFGLFFLFGINNVQTIFIQIQSFIIPVLLMVMFSVGFSLLSVRLINHEPIFGKQKQLIRSFEKYLLGFILVSFSVMIALVMVVNDKIVLDDYKSLLLSNITDIRDDTSNTLDNDLLKTTKMIANEYVQGITDLNLLAQKYDVPEINIIREQFNVDSNKSENIGFDMRSSDQSKAFMQKISLHKEYVQAFMPMGQFSNVNKKYAGVSIGKLEYLQVGYDSDKFQNAVKDHISQSVKYRHIGKAGRIIVFDLSGNFVGKKENAHSDIRDVFSQLSDGSIPEQTLQQSRFDDKDYTWMYDQTNGFYIMALIPTEEVLFSKNLSTYTSLFIGIIVFSLVFALIYILVNKLVVEDLNEVNKGLTKITDGNLETSIDVRSNQEFANLSNDINQMVSSLKQLIDEASTRYSKDLDYARIIQKSVLPDYQSFAGTRNDIRLFASMNPAENVGGDFYDFFSISEDRLVFCIADVSGKSIPAAMFMMRVKTLLHSLVEKDVELAEAFNESNHLICESNDAGMFVTVWMGIYDIRSGILRYVNAGHNPPLICRYNGKYEYLRSKPNLVLGGYDGIKYRVNEIDFHPGDRIYLYTDGVTEANNIDEELFGEKRLINVLNDLRKEERSDDYPTVDDDCKAVQNALEAFVGDANQFDDICMLGISSVYLKNGDHAEFAGTMESMKILPSFLDECNSNHNVPRKTAVCVQVCADEIMSNIVKYGKAETILVDYFVDNNMVVLEFKDNGILYDPSSAEVPDITLSAEDRPIGGLGLLMVHKMTSAFIYSEEDGWNHNQLMIDFK